MTTLRGQSNLTYYHLNSQVGQNLYHLVKSIPSPSLLNGGGEGNRTHDPLRAKQVLSQLSYTPNYSVNVVGLDRFELSTSRLSGVRSNQLSYRPIRSARFH